MESPTRQRVKRRPSPKYLSVEMILRKSFCDSMKEYLKNCSLAGAKKLHDPNIGKIARTFWAAIFVAALCISAYFFFYIWNDTLDKPLIVTLESATYPIGSIDFPAVAVCNINRISKKALTKLALEEYADLTKGLDASLEQVEKALLNWGRLINYSYNETLRIDPIVSRLNEKYRADRNQKIPKIMQMLAPTCEDMFVKCVWAGAVVDCKDLFEMHRVANRGHCCTFNYWKQRLKAGVKRQTVSGLLYGLNLLLDAQVDDYAFPLGPIRGFDVSKPFILIHTSVLPAT